MERIFLTIRVRPHTVSRQPEFFRVNGELRRTALVGSPLDCSDRPGPLRGTGGRICVHGGSERPLRDSGRARPAAAHPRWPFDRPAVHPLPNPASVRTLAELHAAVTDILREHDVGVVSSTMRASLSTVRLLGRWPERVDAETFERFLRACGAGQAETAGWLAAWRAIVEQPVTEPVVVDAVVAAVPQPAPQRPLPDPSMADSYDELLCALRSLQAGAAMSTTGVELSTGGRLAAERVGAILAGSLPASGEEWVLLLRAFGLRDEVGQWVEAWRRLDGATLGSARPVLALRWLRRSRPGPADVPVLLATLSLTGLLTVLLALLV